MEFVLIFLMGISICDDFTVDEVGGGGCRCGGGGDDKGGERVWTTM